MAKEEYQWTKKNQNPTFGLIEELNILLNNLEHGWKCKKYKVTKTNKSNSNQIKQLNYTIEVTLTPVGWE